MAFGHNQTISFSVFICVYFLSAFILSINSLSMVSISETSNKPTLICALQPSNNLHGQPHLNCSSFPPGIQIPRNPNTSFSEIVGGNGFVCALRPPSSSSKSVMGCWRFSNNASNPSHKRLYRGRVLQNLDAGNSQICGLVGESQETNRLQCWQWRNFNRNTVLNFSSIAVGENFVCGLSQTGNIACLGSNVEVVGQEPIGNYTVIAAGHRHACAISVYGNLECWGDTVGEKPEGWFNSLALGENRGCALRVEGGKVACWGSNNFTMPESLKETSFVAIVAKQSIFCGVKSDDFSLYCWGNEIIDPNTKVFESVLPGSCRNENQCQYGPLEYSARLCGQNKVICKLRDRVLVAPESPSTLTPPGDGNNDWSSKMVAFLVVGCVGSVSLLLVLAFFLYRYCIGNGCRVHDSGRLDESGTLENTEEVPQTQLVQGEAPQVQTAPPVLEKRLSNIVSLGNGSHLEEFPLHLLLEATNNFCEDHKIGTGSFGSVYHATLEDGREVAIKRAEISSSSPSRGATRLQEDNDDAFIHELESLSRLNHKNLVRLLGYHEDCNERILVFEYMNNGNLNDHLHELHSAPIMTWAGRIKVALDAAKGIRYLHEYANPPVIHRDIKPANILLDAKWTAKVSDFGLSLMGPEDEESHLSLNAAGTLGYMDPEYYRLQLLTTKSDVFSFGVVLLELLSGYKAIHKNEFGVLRNVVDFVVPYIVQDEIHRVLDPKMPPPTPYEIEAVIFVGHLSAACVRLEGRDRPSMCEVVNSLERALTACLAHLTVSPSTTGSSH